MEARTTHLLTVSATCPVDFSSDEYEVVIRTSRTLPVEQIHEVVDYLTAEPVFQEHFTTYLAKHLGVRVRTVGVHSGVKTICRAGTA